MLRCDAMRGQTMQGERRASDARRAALGELRRGVAMREEADAALAAAVAEAQQAEAALDTAQLEEMGDSELRRRHVAKLQAAERQAELVAEGARKAAEQRYG